jgi:D-beta-D-heptose 7-phosphate kinase/D-beta-D-heptose 1-phosphate adenosyltransferase
MTYDIGKLTAAANHFGKCRIAVVGDLMLDIYIWGNVTRISPEAPVPIVHVQKETNCLGGAANVMRNAVTMGGKEVYAFGVVGDDANGEEVHRQLETFGIDSGGVYSDPRRRTIEKQRIIAGHQQLLRIDFEDVREVENTCREYAVGQMMKLIEEDKIDAIIFEDYGKGMLSEEMLETVIPAARAKGIVTALDPKPGHLRPVRGLSFMKPNRSEAFAMAGRVFRDQGLPPREDPQLLEVAEILLDEWAPECLVISLAAQGMALFRRNHEMLVIPTRAQEVFDVSGAGDTVIAALTLGLAAGADIADAAHIANFAAGIVVGRVGTATVSAAELIRSFSLA